MNQKISRRQFNNMALALAGTTFSQSSFGLPTKTQQTPHFFIHIMHKGGMDATLGLDPKVHTSTTQKDIFLEYQPNEIMGHSKMKLGPGAASLSKHAQDICIFNGIVMREPAAHDLQRLNISSGKGDYNCPNYCAEISALKHSSLPILVKGPIVLGNRDIELVSLGGFKRDLLQTVSTTDSNFTNVMQSIFKNITNFRPAQLNYFRYLQSLQRASQLIQDYSLDPQDDNVAIAASLASNTVSTVNYVTDENFDTHANHVENHLALQKKSFTKVAELMTLLKTLPYKGGSIFDNTTLAVTTEFSRTPYLNNPNTLGKDHNFMTNSVLLAGKGIQGNQSVGSSFIAPASERPEKVGVHVGNFYDYENSKSVAASSIQTLEELKQEKLSFIFPENLAATIYKNFDVPIKKTQIDHNAKTVLAALKN